ncbi:killer cell lectin-like receptor subfamily B member 1B allele C [Carettochelys insculpta]|uniref:killer cell lectin-like receptor subfamily B member 1B allele C n=1 Tax=Carettochelys insculpta TaxID=44489 RepID=UPI003EBA0B46
MRLLRDSVLFSTCSPSSALSMASEIVYADLNILGGSSRPQHPPQHFNCPPCPRWHRLALRLGAAGILLLLGAVTAMGVLVSQPKVPLNLLENNSTTDTIIPPSSCSPGLTDFYFRLKQFVCEPFYNSSADGAGCRLCPLNWLLHRDKCYWVSTAKNSWNKSRDDCSRKGSRLWVIRDQEEMGFIQKTSKDKNKIWLGLTITSLERKRLWVDGSLLNQTLFHVKDPATGNNCGVIRTGQIHFETCTSASKWICEQEALPIQ